MGIWSKKEKTNFEVLPNHVGVIMDGNGRWAKKRGLPRSAGHKKGANTFQAIAEYASDLGIPYVTFYCFSSENWKRPQAEVDAIMDLFRQYLMEAEERQEEGKKIKVSFIGDRNGIAPDLLELMDRAQENTKDHEGTMVNLAINYGGRQEIVHACKEVAQLMLDGKMAPEEISEQTIQEHLYAGAREDLDLIIRPSGEQRLSNFLLWQAAYAELWTSEVLWPDFSKADFDAALEAYANRNRRFGA